MVQNIAASQIHHLLAPYACRNRWVLSFYLKERRELAALSPRGREFQSLGPAMQKHLAHEGPYYRQIIGGSEAHTTEEGLKCILVQDYADPKASAPVP